MRNGVLRSSWVTAAALFVGCSPPPPKGAADEDSSPAAASSRESSGNVGAADSTNPSAGAETETSGGESATASGKGSAAHQVTTSPLSELKFERLLETPITSFALGNGPRIAALGAEPWIFDGTKWREVPVPGHLRNWDASHAQVRIFYGRDNQPRLMGWTEASGSSELGGVYLRHKATGWQREPAELGRLGNSRGALYGILGEADPEVVCRPEEICLIKRVSGWAQTAADAEPAWIQMAGNQVFKVTDSQVSLLVRDAWETVNDELPPGKVANVWGDGEQTLYLVAGGVLSKREGSKWASIATPLEASHSLAAQNESEIWVGGAIGLCRFGPNKGVSWQCAQEKLGTVVQVEVTAEAVFAAGDQGLFRASL